jgi:TM2 domain-containing membrane protein YozV
LPWFASALQSSAFIVVGVRVDDCHVESAINKKKAFMTETLPSTNTEPSPAANGQRSSTHSVFIGYLLWVLGFTGAHRFYFGKSISGAIWLCTFGLFGIGWLVDLFLIPGMERTAERKYVAGKYDYTVAWVLHTYLLGLFGAHRFYIGKWGTGLIYLFTGGIFGIGFIYDFFTLNGQVSERNMETVGEN